MEPSELLYKWIAENVCCVNSLKCLARDGKKIINGKRDDYLKIKFLVLVFFSGAIKSKRYQFLAPDGKTRDINLSWLMGWVKWGISVMNRNILFEALKFLHQFWIAHQHATDSAHIRLAPKTNSSNLINCRQFH